MFISEGDLQQFLLLKGGTEMQKPYKTVLWHGNKVISDDNQFPNFMYTTFQ